MFVLCLQAQEMGKDAGRFLFWMKSCQSHGPVGVVVDDMGGGDMERNLPSFLPCLLNVHYDLGLSQLPQSTQNLVGSIRFNTYRKYR